MQRSAIEVAVGLLARREHSVLEIKRKLQQRGFDEEEMLAAIEQLQVNKLLSEERFTESYINMRKLKGYGPLRIEQELRERGIAGELSNDFLDKNNPLWRRIMKQQYEKKYGNKPAEEYAEKAKRSKYLQTRGFPLDWVFQLDSLEEID